MKKRKILLIMMLLSFLFIVSCGKEGPAGPEGPVGPQGPGECITKTFPITPTKAEDKIELSFPEIKCSPSTGEISTVTCYYTEEDWGGVTQPLPATIVIILHFFNFLKIHLDVLTLSVLICM